MTPEYILDADLLDIIFENRNKDYGAYSLRRHYDERLYKALAIIFLAAIMLALVGILSKNRDIAAPVISDTIFASPPVDIPRDKTDSPKPPLPRKQTVAAAVPSTNFKAISEHSNSSGIEITKEGEQIKEPDPGESNTIPSNTQPGGGLTGSSAPGVPSTNTAGGEPGKTIDKNVPQAADIMPAFPGGIEALKKFLKKNLVTPKDIERSETVSVKVQFIVGYDGQLKGFKVIEDGGTVFNEEVIRVIKKMPAWIPGKAHGENVSVYYTIPVLFTTEE